MAYSETFIHRKIDDLNSLCGRFIRNAFFYTKKIPEGKQARLLTSIVVCTDKAKREYNFAVESMHKHHSVEGDYNDLIIGLGHFENCINAIKRSLRVLNRIKGEKDLPSIDKAILNIIQKYEPSITNIRDSIEHLEGELLKSIEVGEAHLLAIKKDGLSLELGKNEIKISDIENVIRKLHLCTEEIINMLPSINRD
jgi:hypothetical protein